MNCLEARERLSDWLDEALSAAERAELGAHLEDCPDCRRELDRLRATVGILARVERPRAPVGFVDRVMARAYPAPWYRRLGRRLFLPLGVKLPAQAAAMLVIAVIGVYLLQRTPELRDAARPEPEAPASRAERAPAPAPHQESWRAGRPDTGKVSGPEPKAGREAENALGAGRRLDSAQPPPPVSQDYRQDGKKEADTDRLQKMPALTSPATSAPQAAPPAELRAKRTDAAEERSAEPSKSLAQQAPAASAKPESTMSGALGRLNVRDRPAADNELADLLVRVGGTETGRRTELGATLVEVLVPDARYTDFVRGLTMMGAWSLEGKPAALPTDPTQLRLTIRISE